MCCFLRTTIIYVVDLLVHHGEIMKVSKAQLKNLIKECLVEILAEGLGQPTMTQIQETKQQVRRPAQVPGRPAFNPALDTPVDVKSLVRQATGGNPMLDAMLMETAGNFDDVVARDPSLHGVMADPGGIAQQVGPSDHTNGRTPEELFGEGMTANWLKLI